GIADALAAGTQINEAASVAAPRESRLIAVYVAQVGFFDDRADVVRLVLRRPYRDRRRNPSPRWLLPRFSPSAHVRAPRADTRPIAAQCKFCASKVPLESCPSRGA